MAAIIGGALGIIGAGALETAGLGTTAAEVGAAVSGSEAIGTFIGGAAVAKAGQTIAQTAEEGINKAVDYFVPEETQKSIYDSFTDFKAAYNAYESQDPSIFIKRQKEKALEMRIEDDEGDEVGNEKDDPTYDPNAVLPYGGNPIIYNADIDPTIHYVDRPEDDDRGNIITAQQELKQKKMRNISSSELARFIIGYSSDLSFSKDPQESLTNFIQKNPSQLDTVERINNYLADKSLPTSQEFQEIYKVYNGRNITRDSFKFYYDNEGLFHILATDETGTTIDMPENTGYVLPSVPGTVYMGPFSKNDRMPTDNPLDWFSVFHDYGFRNGLNRIADMKFVSRIQQNRDRIPPDYLNLANSTIIYFSNISMTLGSMFGSQNPEDLIKGPKDNMAIDDIFPIMQPSAKELPDKEYQTARYNFYKELDESLKEESVTSSMFAQISNSTLGQYFAQELGDLLVQVV